MAGFFKRLFSRDPLQGAADLATGDWSPVPVYAANPGPAAFASWLQEKPQPRRPPGRRRRRSMAFMRFLSPQERQIVEQQRREQRPEHHSREGRETKSAGWVDVLKAYGEHLTDDELAIIRRQLGK
jgi:hypothetical protein